MERLSVNGLIVTEAVVAQATNPAEGLLSSPMIPIFVIILILWIMMFRSKRRDDKKKQELLDAVKRGDRVQTIGGILGNVVQVEKDKILLKVDESSNTKIWFSRNAVFRVLGEEKVEQAKA